MDTLRHVVAPFVQSSQQYDDELRQSEALHREEIAINRRTMHNKLAQEARYIEAEVQLKRTLHLADIGLEIDLERRDAIRDVFRQRSQITQIIMITDTMLIGCSYAMIFRFVPPKESPPGGINAYSTSVIIGLLLLVASCLAALQLQRRLGEFDFGRELKRYRCGRMHSTFNSYYACHCAGLENVAMRLLYAGASATVLGAAVFMSLEYWYVFRGLGPAVVFAALCGATIVVFVLGDVLVPGKTHDGALDFVGLPQRRSAAVSGSTHLRTQ